VLKLIAFVACETVLSDERNNPSLISVFSALDIGHVAGQAISPEAVSPQRWKVFTQWNADEADIGQEFTQKISIAAPDGREFGGAETDFKLETRSHNIKISVEGMPVGVEGNIVMKVWVKSGTKTITEIHTSEISIRHSRTK